MRVQTSLLSWQYLKVIIKVDLNPSPPQFLKRDDYTHNVELFTFTNYACNLHVTLFNYEQFMALWM
jgi:hypothetical protein